MQRSWWKLTAALCVAAALFSSSAARADDAKFFVGNWKLTDVGVAQGTEQTYVLFQVEEKDGKLQAKALASPLLGGTASIENFKSDGKSMQFDVKFPNGTLAIKAYAPKADAKNKDVLGTLTFGQQLMFLQFNKTDDKELTADDAVTQTDAGKQLVKALRTRDLKERQQLLHDVIEKNADKGAACTAYNMLLQTYAKEPPKEDEAGKTAEQYVKVAARFGPEAEHFALANACKALSMPEKVSPSALAFLENAEKTMLKDSPAATTVTVLKSLASALTKSGKEEDAKKFEPRIAKLEMVLDTEYEKTAVPFKVSEYKGESKRVAVVELFTGAYCPPCVAADVAFDAAMESFKPKDVIMLQYHVHIPRPDRLTNEDTEKRMEYYRKSIRGVPTAFVNGTATKPLGGAKSGGQRSYDTLRDTIEDALQSDVLADLKLKVERKGDKLDITGDVSNLKDPGENVKLRFVLIEDVARYPGGNGQRLHHHVVRAMPGGPEGFALKDKTAKQNVAVNLVDLKKSLDEYMTKFNKSMEGPFMDNEYPLNLKNLKVIALIQDDDTQKILQAVQIDVPDAK